MANEYVGYVTIPNQVIKYNHFILLADQPIRFQYSHQIELFYLTGFRVQAFADIVFLYDDSGSVGSDPKNFLLMKTFMKSIVGDFSFCGIGGTQFGAACFAHNVKNHFHLKTHSTSTAVQAAIMKFPTRHGHATAIGTALAVSDMIFRIRTV